jgi:zinc transport system substrate-binding protein
MDTDQHNRHGHGADPHIWLNPRLLKIQAATMTDALCAVDPDHAENYRDNFRALVDRMNRTDSAIRAVLDPFERRAFFVFHPAWGYFADEYGLRQIAIEVEGKAPSDAELTKFGRLAGEEGIKVIFVQPQIADESAKAVADTIGGRVQTLDPLADDIDANLMRAAKLIAQSFGEGD